MAPAEEIVLPGLQLVDGAHRMPGSPLPSSAQEPGKVLGPEAASSVNPLSEATQAAVEGAEGDSAGGEAVPEVKKEESDKMVTRRHSGRKSHPPLAFVPTIEPRTKRVAKGAAGGGPPLKTEAGQANKEGDAVEGHEEDDTKAEEVSSLNLFRGSCHSTSDPEE